MTHPIIHRLRKHPEHVRRKILFVATAVSFGILLVLWGISAGYRVADVQTKTAIKSDLKRHQVRPEAVRHAQGERLRQRGQADLAVRQERNAGRYRARRWRVYRS
ncbi:MAG: hypothetical protein WDN09_03635 [bacterium]